MEFNEFNELLETSNNLSDIARKLYGKDNYSCREKVKKIFTQFNVDWVEWRESKKRCKFSKCANCGRIFEATYIGKKFCSHSCSATFNNKHRKHSIETREKISRTMQSLSKDFDGNYKELNTSENDGYCKYCGNKLKNKRSVFCDNTCYSKFKRKEYLERWKSGEENGLSGKYEIRECVRDFLIESANYCCEVCGCNMVNPYTHKTILQIHHKDGDCTNNKPNNLMVLCPNCHAMTENFGSRNKNATRKDNRKRY